MRIFLHVGIWKTGSTAIQTFLAKNAEQLRDSGVLIPEYATNMWDYNHLFERLVARDDAGVQAVIDSIQRDLATTSPETLIISSEHFWHAPPDVLNRVAEMLRQFSEDITVIAYIRPQEDMWASLYAQQAKFFRVRSGHKIWGNGDYIGAAIGENALFYHRCFSVYEQIFGAGSVQLKLYDRSAFRDNDVVQDFLQWVGAPSRDDYVESELDENSSFGWKGVALSIWLADRLHRGETAFEDQRAAGKALRFAMRDAGRKYRDLAWYGKAPECFGPDERADIRAHYAEDTSALAETFFGGDTPFPPPSDRSADPFDLAQIPEAELSFAKRRLQKRIARTFPPFSRDRWVPPSL